MASSGASFWSPRPTRLQCDQIVAKLLALRRPQTLLVPVLSSTSMKLRKSSTLPKNFSRTVQEDKVTVQPLGPKYLSIDQIRPLYGLTRGVLYALIREGRVKNVSIIARDPSGKARSRGKRLIEVASLESYLSGLAKGGE